MSNRFENAFRAIKAAKLLNEIAATQQDLGVDNATMTKVLEMAGNHIWAEWAYAASVTPPSRDTKDMVITLFEHDGALALHDPS